MVMLSWTKLNPICKEKATSKKYYGQYLYKVVLEVPAGRIINDKQNLSIESLLDMRKNNYLFHRPNLGAFNLTRRKWEQLHNADVEKLKYWQDTLMANKSLLKYRIEEPWMQIYSNDELLLYNLVSNTPSCLRAIHKPKNLQSLLALEQNEILVNKVTDYNYKIFLKEGYKISPELRESIGKYLINLGTDVKLTKSTQYNFTRRGLWFNGTYFYAKNKNVLIFLDLMAPGIISGIYKLTCIKQ